MGWKAELEALIRALRLVEINNWQDIVMEGDCKPLMLPIASNGRSPRKKAMSLVEA